MEPPEPKDRANYTPEEEGRIVEALRSGDPPDCPRCGDRLEPRDVPPRPEVAYVRDRLWLACPGCRRGFVVDRRRLE